MTSHAHDSALEYDGGIVVIDSGYFRQHVAACYLLEAGSEAAFIEVGTNSSTPALMQTLGARGWEPGDVRYVIVTHVHLDHAGGAGSLMQLLPNATLLVHPYGARHMIDPAKLEAGARVVYGDRRFDRVFGRLIPVPEERTRIVEDGEEIGLGNRRLRFMDTPGHARHHFCIHDSLSNGWFSGDTFGLSYREFDTANGEFVFPSTTPIQFDPETLKRSVAKLVADWPDFMYLTHYGRVAQVQRLAQDMVAGIDTMVGIAEQYRGATDRGGKIEAAMCDWLLGRLAGHGVTLARETCLELILPDVEINTQGLEHWLDHGRP